MAVKGWGSMSADNTFIQFHTDLLQSLGNTNANINPTPLRIGLTSLAVRRIQSQRAPRASGLRNIGWGARSANNGGI